MSDDTGKIVAQYIPTKGLNRHFDPSLFGSEFAFTLKNFVIDRGVLRTRDGLTKESTAQFTTKPNGIYLGRFMASDGSTTECLVVKDGAALKVASSNALTSVSVGGDIGTLENTRGQFFAYGNFIYYTARPLTPTGGHAVIKIGSEYATDGAMRAGCVSPDRTKLILDETSTDDWTVQHGSAASTTEDLPDTNKTHFYIGEQGIVFESTTLSQTSYFSHASLNADLTEFSDGIANGSTVSDYIAFTLYKYEKAALTSLKLRMYVGSSTTKYFECTVFDTVSAVGGWKLSSAYAKTWDNDGRDYHIVDIRLKKDWFTLNGSAVAADWNNIGSVMFVMTTSALASTTKPAKLTISNMRLQSATPTPTFGKTVADFESTESWNENGTTIVRTTDYKTEGVHSLRITAAASPGTTAVGTYSLDLSNVEEGSALGAFDWLVASVACVSTSTVTFLAGNLSLKVKLVSAAHSANVEFVFADWGHLSILANKPIFKQVKRPFTAITNVVTYTGAGHNSFATFPWSEISSVEITAIGTAASGTLGNVKFYVDNIYVQRGKYRKYIAAFTPGVLDIASTGNDEGVQNLLSAYPAGQVAANAIGWVMDATNALGKYKTAGIGSYLMPDFENAERGNWSIASLRITAGGEGTPNLLGLANGVSVGDVEGFRVAFPARIAGGALDLTNYGTPFSAVSATLGTVTIDEADIVRCWMKVSKISKLSKVKFRLYTSGAETLLDWWGFDMDDSKTVTYWEYVWDASQVYNKEYLEARAQQEALADQVADPTTSKLNQVLEMAQGSAYGQVKIPSGTPEWIVGGLKQIGSKESLAWLGIEGSSDNTKNREGLAIVAKWRMRDFTWKGGGAVIGSAGSESVDLSKVTGISIEVVPVPGESVDVSFDNWYVYKSGNLTGNFWYCTTYINKDGEESAPSWPSEMVTANGEDIAVKELPSTWPTDVVAMNIYRMGGDSTEWRLARTIGAPTSSIVDSTVEGQLGALLVDNGFEPPRAEYAAVIGNRVYYANFIDRYNHLRSSGVAISQPHMPGFVKLENYRDLAPNDGSEITGIVGFLSYKIVTKTTSVWTLDGEDNIPNQRVSWIGNIAPKSLAVTDRYVIFLGSDGFYTYNTNDCSPDVGMPVRNIIVDIMATTNGATILKQAVGFMMGEYYWFFYGDTLEDDGSVKNTNCLALHIASGWWTQAEFTVATGIDADIQAGYVDSGVHKAYVGSNATGNKYLTKFLVGNTDAPSTDSITSTFQSGHLPFGYPAQEKRVKALYVRVKAINSTESCTFRIYPTVEEVQAQHSDVSGSTYEHVDDGTITDKYKTFCFSNPAAANGFVHQLTMIVTGRIEVSNLTEVLDVLPMRNV